MNPLTDLRGIIYLIKNRVNGMSYIGQSINPFIKRYRREWWKKVQCRPLKVAIKEYGPEGFEISILEHSKTRKQLDELEILYANQYDSYYPKGYNVKRCGSNEYVTKVPLLHGIDPVRLRSPSGEVFAPKDLISFCTEHGVDKYCMWKLVTGRSPYQQGWTLADDPNTGHPNWTEYTLYDREGNPHVIPNMSRFCREHGFSYSKLRGVITGNNHEAYGLALSVDNFTKRRKRYVVTLAHESGREVTLTHIKSQSRSIGLDPFYVYALKNGKRVSYLGWKLVKSEHVFF